MWVYPANVLVLLHYSGATSGEGKPLVLIAAAYFAILFILRLSRWRWPSSAASRGRSKLTRVPIKV